MHTFKTVTVALGSAAVLAAGTSAAAADTAGSAATSAVEWSAGHGSSTASGVRWTEKSGSGIGSALVVEGELENAGPECYSVWVRWTRDLAPLPYTKSATRCGTGSAPVGLRLDPYWPTTTGYLKVCRGTEDTRDCGEAVSLTSWPING
ncbi:hypothetical protein [Streptomyces sp. NEAU-W12]|uniref:hypothetical protein n=1 Tax=Streptomyces sp. NEAU-W12 TaxID=2994668 RepID=UPI00224B8FAE|nr:hypothetical protein [Streptomyces sp. NEAU-W12]MCX2925735.1 hypothetical protein [Streptomyces sp. NEAU-W12]